MNDKVTVIGTGRMGSALATALYNKGFVTTVWNRTLTKTEPLARLGIHVARSIKEAILESEVIIANIRDYSATSQLLQNPDVESALRGKILVQLASGTPQEARAMESWARKGEISYLDGAIESYPAGIGTPECTIFYSGSPELFNRLKPLLLAFGDNALLVGHEVGQASALEISFATFALGGMFGFLHGYIMCEMENHPPEVIMQSIKGLMPFVEEMISDIFRRLQDKDFGSAQASLDSWSKSPKNLRSWCQDRKVDHSIADAHLGLIDKAISAGQDQADFAYLYEVLKKG